MKLSRDQVVKLFGTRGEDEGQAIDDGICQGRGSNSGITVHVVYAGSWLVLSDYECKIEGKVLVVGKANEEGGRAR